MIRGKNCFHLCVAMLCSAQSWQVFAQDTKADIQKRLNEQVLSQPMNMPDDDTLNKSLDAATERGKPSKSKTKDGYYRYWYNGYYYPHPYWYYGYPRYW